MSEHVTQSGRRLVGAAGALLAAATCFMGPGSGRADAPVKPTGSGTYHKGELKVPLHRGAAVPFELSVIATPDNCANEPTLTIKWDEEDNTVDVHLEGHHVLKRKPSVTRTLGVDYTPNAFFPEPKDVTNGRYMLWIIAGGGANLTFYYDPGTLNLMGSNYDFPTPPPAIPVTFPSLRLTPTGFFQPDEDGNLDFHWTFAYDQMLRGDRPEFSHHFVTFPPPNLCGANPFRFDLSTLRPYITDPRPASEAVSWSDYVRDGLLFDITVEPDTYYTEPPRTTLLATYSGATVVGGTVPKGWTLDLDAAFGNVAPPVRQWAGAGACQQVFKPMHTQNLNFCPPPAP